jgi:hypothetical protein
MMRIDSHRYTAALPRCPAKSSNPISQVPVTPCWWLSLYLRQFLLRGGRPCLLRHLKTF